jgi:hypothetical protein
MVEARSGRVLRTIDVDLNPWDIAVDQHADRTFMSTGQGLWPSATPGRVQVLDGRTGRRLRTVHSGALPSVPETTSLRTNGTEAEQQRLTAFLQRRLPDSPLAHAGTCGRLDSAERPGYTKVCA